MCSERSVAVAIPCLFLSSRRSLVWTGVCRLKREDRKGQGIGARRKAVQEVGRISNGKSVRRLESGPLTVVPDGSRHGVGSRTGAVFRRSSLAIAPRFLWECLSSQTVNPFPAPATSHPACGFPALGAPVCLVPRFMGPI